MKPKGLEGWSVWLVPTLYLASILSVTRQRFTKHYFTGDKLIASKIGAGIFQNAYGHSANVVTAGQKDYQMRMMQIERQCEDYYRKLGTPPGVPTMKGATADPDNTGYGYNTIIGELGDHSVTEGWVQRRKFNDNGDVPGPPIQWQKPEDPDNAQPGYGYVPTDTTNIEDIFFYHSDHLGSTSYITDAKANITQFDAYLPYGELLVDEHSSTEEMPYKFNGKEFDEETGLYYYGARYINPRTSLWYGVDPLAEKYPEIGGYIYYHNNSVRRIDPIGLTDYDLTPRGEIHERKGTIFQAIVNLFTKEDKRDKIYLTGKDKPLAIYPEGTLQKIEGNSLYTKVEIKEEKYASDFFNKVIDNTQVEWANIHHVNKNGKESHTIVTQYLEDEVSIAIDKFLITYIKRGEIIKLFEHSHPIPQEHINSNLLGFGYLDPSEDDFNTARKHPNIIFNVYNLLNRKIEYYNGKKVYKTKKLR